MSSVRPQSYFEYSQLASESRFLETEKSCLSNSIPIVAAEVLLRATSKYSQLASESRFLETEKPCLSNSIPIVAAEVLLRATSKYSQLASESRFLETEKPCLSNSIPIVAAEVSTSRDSYKLRITELATLLTLNEIQACIGARAIDYRINVQTS